MTLIPALHAVFCSNFVAYYKSHASHVNVVGRHFVSDHELLNKIYDDLQDEIDSLGEILRTVDAFFPLTLSDVLDGSLVNDNLMPDYEDGVGYLTDVYDDLDILISTYQDLESAASSREDSHIANYAQDRVRTLKKFCCAYDIFTNILKDQKNIIFIILLRHIF